MPRIRTIKPEAPQHRKVGRLTDRAFRLWVVMVTQSDDEGRLVADPDQLRVLAFGYQPETLTADVVKALGELSESGLIRRYMIEGTPYADFPSWHDHQRINRPTPSKLPSFDDSVSAHGVLTEDSVRTHAGSEGIGKDQGEERRGRRGGDEGEENHRGAAPPGPPAGVSRHLGEAKKQRTGKPTRVSDLLGDNHDEEEKIERVSQLLLKANREGMDWESVLARAPADYSRDIVDAGRARALKRLMEART